MLVDIQSRGRRRALVVAVRRRRSVALILDGAGDAEIRSPSENAAEGSGEGRCIHTLQQSHCE